VRSGRREEAAGEAQRETVSSSPLPTAGVDARPSPLCYIRVIALVKYVINSEQLFFSGVPVAFGGGDRPRLRPAVERANDQVSLKLRSILALRALRRSLTHVIATILRLM
jgi:hypothetical protein